MSDVLSAERHRAAHAYAAQGMEQIENRHFSHLGRYARLTRRIGRIGGAVALGVLSAGIAIFGVVIVLNVIFQYAPAP